MLSRMVSRCRLNSDLLVWWVSLQGANAAFSLYVVVYDIDKYMDKYGRLLYSCSSLPCLSVESKRLN